MVERTSLIDIIYREVNNGSENDMIMQVKNFDPLSFSCFCKGVGIHNEAHLLNI